MFTNAAWENRLINVKFATGYAACLWAFISSAVTKMWELIILMARCTRANLFSQYVTCQTRHFASLTVIGCLSDGCLSGYAN